jgi:hypothetical protein
MSYLEREIVANFLLAKGDFGETGQNSLTISGLRIECEVNNAGGVLGSDLLMKVYGMKESDMTKCCTFALSIGSVKDVTVTVMAGDKKSGMSQIFQGTIFYGMIDYNEMPTVPLVIQARAGYVEQSLPAAPNSTPGPMDVTERIKALAQSIDFTFTNNGVNKSLQNHYSWGSPIEQIRDIARAASIDLDISNGTISIWPYGGTKDNQMVEVSAAKGLVGYPTYIGYGYTITTTFSADIVRGRRCRLDGGIPRAKGDFFFQEVRHYLTSQVPNGPWFTISTLTVEETVGVLN